jgi:endonuclease III-like uncharacterized protein
MTQHSREFQSTDYEQLIRSMLEDLDEFLADTGEWVNGEYQSYRLPLDKMDAMIEVITPKLLILVQETSKQAVQQVLVNQAETFASKLGQIFDELEKDS